MNHTISHPTQPEMQVEVILASQGPDQAPIYTLRMRMPRIIWPECLTHRMFSRNARSSRAVPVKTMLNEVRTTPFIPWHWGANQKGMQADEECNELVNFRTLWESKDGTKSHTFGNKIGHLKEAAWLAASEHAVEIAEAYMNAGYHKQIVNRLLEPFSWIDVLITSTDWSNFLWLRNHKDAEPHLQDLARLVKQAIDEAEVQQLQPGAWHAPYINETTLNWLDDTDSDERTDSMLEQVLKISAARCARISYKPFDSDSSYEKELARYDMLVSSDRVHASPTEHQATPDLLAEDSPLRGPDEWENPHLHGNLEGYIQARKLIPNERA